MTSGLEVPSSPLVSGAQARPALAINMVATRVEADPIARRAGAPLWSVILVAMASTSDASAKPSAAQLPLVNSDRPEAGFMLDWYKAALPVLTPDERALVEGYDPPGAIQYAPLSLPAELVADSHTGVTPAMAATREALRLDREDQNNTRALQRASHLRTVKLGL